MTCIVCGTDHAESEPCPTMIRRSGSSGTLAMATPVGTPAEARELGGLTPVVGLPQAVIAQSAQAPEGDVDALIGSTLGSFKVVRKLGRGGMGTVYLGEHAMIGSKVAIKVLHDHLAANPSVVQRFYAEARAVNLIGHENIVSIFDMGVAPPSRYFLVMEYLEGTPLSHAAQGPMAADVALPILSQVCDALQAAHARGVVHRDLKPENIFLIKRARNDHFVKVLDFGIAKLFASESGEHTSAGMIIGTPEFMSPEQCGSEPVDGRSDVYALGVISYLLATGRLPFSGPGLTALLVAHREKVPPAPHTLIPEINRAWSDATMRALAKTPADRFDDAEAFRKALDAALVGVRAQRLTPVPYTVVAPSELPPPPQPAEERHRASFQATVTLKGGADLGTFTCHDVSRGGVFLRSDGALPALFSRVRVLFNVGGTELPAEAEVVRHVTAEQARAWNMAPGFAVQFVENGPEFKERIGRMVQGLPLAPVAPTPAPRTIADDALAQGVLDFYRRRIQGDVYVVLGVAQDADGSEIRQRGREAMRELDAVMQRAVSTRQREQLNIVREKIRAALDVLGVPMKRAELDARRGNFRGVARSLAAGLTVSELEGLRERFLRDHPSAESRSTMHGLAAQAWENKGDLTRAVEEYEKGLTIDPLNLRLQQRYWALKRRGSTPPPARP